MTHGYVYILINSSLAGMVKIGRTIRDSQARARKLFATGVPTPFEVAFEVFSNDHEGLEAEMHARLVDYRVNKNREFFHYPLLEAINLLIELSGSKFDSTESGFSAISIFHRLKEKYPNWIDPKIGNVQIVQTNERVWLEILEEREIAGYLKDQIIKRTDLGFISGDEHENTFFDCKVSVVENARKFIEEFGPISIINTTDLFDEAANREIYANFDFSQKI